MMPPPEPRALRWLRARRSQGTAGWRPTDALTRGLVGGLGLVAAGVVLHQPALLLIGAPLLLSAVLGVAAAGRPEVTVHSRPRSVEAGRSEPLTVSIDPGPHTELVAIRMPRLFPPGAKPSAGVGRVHLLPASVRTVRTRVRWDDWGEGVELRPDHLMSGPDGLVVFGPVVGRESRRLVLPPVSQVPPGPLPPRTAGLVGVHRSPRPGDGAELRDIRPFQAGDRLRRVDWRVSLRAAAAVGGELVPGTLHVRERHAEADADLVLALDTRIDVGADLGEWSGSASLRAHQHSGIAELARRWRSGGPELARGRGERRAGRGGGSLDTGVRAVVALAASYLRQGDRVGLIDLGSPRLGVRPGAGRRQLERIRHQLVVCGRLAGWTTRPVLRPGQVPPGALVIVLSTFLDDAIADLAAHAARRGNPVIGVDLLPHPLWAQRDTPWGEAVLRILLAEHRLRLAALRGQGIAVVPWGDGTPVAAVLRRLRRRGVMAG